MESAHRAPIDASGDRAEAHRAGSVIGVRFARFGFGQVREREARAQADAQHKVEVFGLSSMQSRRERQCQAKRSAPVRWPGAVRRRSRPLIARRAAVVRSAS